MLGAVMRHGEETVSGMVRVIISDLLVSLDTRQLNPTLVWEGLRTIARSCKCWLSTAKKAEEQVVKEEREVEIDTEEADMKGSVGIGAIADFFRQYHRDKEKAELEGGGAEAMQDQQDRDQLEEEDYSGQRTLSAPEQVSVDIMQRCAHHMAHDSPRVRLVVMETLQHCMEALSHDKVRD